MHHFSLTILWLTSLILPALFFLTLNNFKSRTVTMIRALLAIAGGWVFMVAYTTVAQIMSSVNVEPTNGAAMAFASTFGWVLPTVIVVFTWVAVYFIGSKRFHNVIK